MIERFNAATQGDQVMLIIAAFLTLWFLANVLVVIARGGSASVWPGVFATVLLIIVTLT
jgi:hypothetical protein